MSLETLTNSVYLIAPCAQADIHQNHCLRGHLA